MKQTEMKILKADDEVVEEQQREQEQEKEPSFVDVTGNIITNDQLFPSKIDHPQGEWMVKKKNESSPRVSMKVLPSSRATKEAKKSIKRLEVELAEKRGYAMCLKQLQEEEAMVMESAIEKMEAKLAVMKMQKQIVSAKNECMEQFIASMLAIFEAEDALV